MQIFSEYIEPLSNWLHTHSNWSMFITFLVAFSESLAIVGALIPGSLTMTVLGILAGTGVIRLDTTLIAAILGAMAGDWGSYFLGYYFSDRITTIWPFSRYPSWLTYGKDFFRRHGGKSVLIGRFVGPFRSIIPVIAGMMHMSHKRFFIANFFSAIGWSLLFIMPGVLIGAASSELSPELATQLFILVLFFITLVWVFSIIVKWLLIRFNRFLNKNLHQIWYWSTKHPYLSYLFQTITPLNENNHYATALLFSCFLLSLVLFILLAGSLHITQGLIYINNPVFLFLQSLRTVFFDKFFIFFSSLLNPFTLLFFGLFICILLAFQKSWRTLFYWVSLNLSAVLLAYLAHQGLQSPYPQGLLLNKLSNSFPATGVTIATVQFFSLILYARDNLYQKFFGLFLTLIFTLAAFAQVYLGDHWLLDIFGGILAGLCLSCFFWIFYRKMNLATYFPTSLMLTLTACLLIFTSLATFKTYQKSLFIHKPLHNQYTFSLTYWWEQKEPILPLYRKNRIGKIVELFNLQYLGSLTALEKTLAQKGWQKRQETFFSTIISRIEGSDFSPLLAELYLYQKPALIMTKRKNPTAPLLLLKLWPSDYHINQIKQPIWIGSIHFVKIKKDKGRNTSPLEFLNEDLITFMKKEQSLPIDPATIKLINISPNLLLIRENPNLP